MHIVIIGNGIAGVTAARHIRKRSDHKITMISAETEHPFSRTALMYIYMGHMPYKSTKLYEDFFWGKNRIDLKQAYVEQVNYDQKELLFQSGEKMKYDKLILAVGSTPNKFGWPGQDLKSVQGLYSYQDLESMEADTKDVKHAVVVGGGLIGIEMAEMLKTRNIGVTFLVREKSFWNNVLPLEESAMINRHINEHHVDLQLETELKEIVADENGKARAVITSKGEEIACQFVGLTAGVRPNVDFLKESGLNIERGIVVNEYLETNITDVYAIGDCAQVKDPTNGRRPIEAVWYVGKIMGGTLAQTICGTATKYDPGVWFNSAKFFDIEYQTYGDVPARWEDNTQSLYWEHENGKIGVRILYDAQTKAVKGFNTFGVRYRQAICDKWIKEKQPIDKVLENLGAANFDPEFYKQYEGDIVAQYNSQNPGSAIQLKKKRGLRSFFEVFNA